MSIAFINAGLGVTDKLFVKKSCIKASTPCYIRRRHACAGFITVIMRRHRRIRAASERVVQIAQHHKIISKGVRRDDFRDEIVIDRQVIGIANRIKNPAVLNALNTGDSTATIRWNGDPIF